MGMSMTGGRARVERTHSARSATKASIVSFSQLRRVPRIGSASVAAAVAGILCGAGAPVYAQEAAEAAPASSDTLQEVVVTANAAQGVKKLDASYNIVSVSLDEIKQANPQSTAEVFKLSPGIWPESSGGQTGVNIDIAGFPNGGGDSPYFTTMIQGAPLYGSPSLSFMDSSSLIRLDDTIERVEIVQGGTSAIFSSGQPGASANFILRTGSDTTKGSVTATYGFEGMERVDAFYSGKITDGWYGSIGGFYRASDGVRDPQYTSDLGGQLTATLKHTMDNGSIMFWYRTLNDRNQWVADFPYLVNGDSVSPYPGFNQLNSTYNSKQLQNFLVPSPRGGFRNDDISDGRGAQLNFFGSELKLKFDNGWSIGNNFIFDGGYLNTHALVNNSNPQTLGDYINGLTNLPAILSPAAVTASLTNGAPVSLNQSVVTQQVWLVEKKLLSVSDEFRVSKELFTGNTATGGLYVAHYTDNDAWTQGATGALITNQPNASPIILQGVAGGNIYNVTNSQGIVSANGGYNILEQGHATNVALYLSDSWRIDQWLFDASVRGEHIDLWQQTSNLRDSQLGSQFDLWDNAVSLPDGTYTERGEHNTVPTFSVGANYEFTERMSAYVRVNNGVLFDNFDDVRCNVINGKDGCGRTKPLTHVRNYEIGYKIQNEFTYIDASAYDKEFKGLSYTPQDIQGVPIGLPSSYGSTAKGIRFIGTVNPFARIDNQPLKDFKITVNGTWENAKYKDFEGCYVYKDINQVTQCGSINGVQLARLPKFQVRVTPSDSQVFDWGSVTEYVTYEHIGQHYQDNTGLNPLGSYYDLAAGIVADYGENWELRVSGSNLTNQLGLTEGNARVGGNAVQNNVGFGRSILGREVSIALKYQW
ncbi:MAG TPA: TonB-dependent receptor plug domain-containing protein [Steroidobacteraceae bacterium]|nr:TonB-dependent receptor plug domain-containing protein [Steroidobacteraceae bacterium]